MNKTDPSIWGSPQIVKKAFAWLNEYLPANSGRDAMVDVFRSWMAARTQALKRDYPSLSKKVAGALRKPNGMSYGGNRNVRHGRVEQRAFYVS
jgi:hypothetical protein